MFWIGTAYSQDATTSGAQEQRQAATNTLPDIDKFLGGTGRNGGGNGRVQNGQNGQGQAADLPVTDGSAAEVAEQRKSMERLLVEMLNLTDPISNQARQAIIRRSDNAAEGNARRAPHFSNVMRDISLDPAAPIPTVEFDLNQPTAISFLDVSGQPWPIKKVKNACTWSNGFAGDWPVEGSNSLVLTAATEVDHGSLVCFMEGLATSVKLILNSGRHEHNIGVDGRILARGPNYRADPYVVGNGGPSMTAGDEILTAFLYGSPPDVAKQLEIQGGGREMQAWLYRNQLYLRTTMTLRSPTVLGHSARGDLNIYRVDPVPVLELNDDGTNVQIRIPNARVVQAKVPQNLEAAMNQPKLIRTDIIGSRP